MILLSRYRNRIRAHAHAEPPVVLILIILVIPGLCDVVRLAARQLSGRPLVFHVLCAVAGKEVTAVIFNCRHLIRVRNLSAGRVIAFHHVHPVAAGAQHHRAPDKRHLVYLQLRDDHLHPHDEVVKLHGVLSRSILGDPISGAVEAYARPCREVLALQIFRHKTRKTTHALLADAVGTVTEGDAPVKLRLSLDLCRAHGELVSRFVVLVLAKKTFGDIPSC